MPNEKGRMLPASRKRASGLPNRVQKAQLLAADEYALSASEKEWQGFVMDYAKLRGWWVMHILRPIGTQAGWPDLTLLRGKDSLFVELKREGGRLSPVQREVLGRLEVAGHRVFVWRPSDRDFVMEMLY